MIPCTVPVALIVFNRPDLTARVFETVRAARPSRLLLIADGPRNDAEATVCRKVREIVQCVDWPCEVSTNFSEHNLGCGRRPATGIDWVFSEVEEAIILEDDCLPAPTFFSYCSALLERYRDEPRVMHISGDDYLLGAKTFDTSYYFASYTFSCGWATWRRAWRHFDFGIRSWPEFRKDGRLVATFPDPIVRKFWEGKLQPIHEGKRNDAWDFQWNYAVWSQGGLSALPSRNLICNLGWRPDGTHTLAASRWSDLPLQDIHEIVHPERLEKDEGADRVFFDDFYGGRRLRERASWSYRLRKPQRLLETWFRRGSR